MLKATSLSSNFNNILLEDDSAILFFSGEEGSIYNQYFHHNPVYRYKNFFRYEDVGTLSTTIIF